MSVSLTQSDCSFAFLSTSHAPAAIAVIEAQGPQVIEWLGTHWQGNSTDAQPNALRINHVRYGVITADLSQGGGESIVLCRTGQARFEIHCHGGMAASKAILNSLQDFGVLIVRDANRKLTRIPVSSLGFAASGTCEPNLADAVPPTPSEHLDLSKSLDANEAGSFGASPVSMMALETLMRATSVATAKVLLDQARGALDDEVERIVGLIQTGDYSDAMSRLDELLQWERFGLHLVTPWKVVLAGPPNAGKSSLLNAILGYRRAIVHAAAGTTRDRIREVTSVGGWLVELTDCAGVRESEDSVEKRGVDHSLAAVQEADLVLLLVPHSTSWSLEHSQILQLSNVKNVIVVETKVDLDGGSHPSEKLDFRATIPPELANRPVVRTSIESKESIESLLKKIEDELVPIRPADGAAVPFTQLQFAALQRAKSHLNSNHPTEALAALASIEPEFAEDAF